jgi:hypothetical protein
MIVCNAFLLIFPQAAPTELPVQIQHVLKQEAPVAVAVCFLLGCVWGGGLPVVFQ